MAAPTSSPSKKLFTDNTKTSIDASNTHRSPVVPEDLNQALQNIGMRVRKSVTEGYNMGHAPTFTVPATPNCSPAKPPTRHTTPTTVFATANAALNSVFPSGSARTPLTPSQRKRTRTDVELDTEMRQNFGGDVEMNEYGVDSDDDPVMVVLGPDANATAFTPPRKIKPLRIRQEMPSSQHNFADPFADPFTFTAQASSIDTPSLLLATSFGDMRECMDMDLSRADKETPA